MDAVTSASKPTMCSLRPLPFFIPSFALRRHRLVTKMRDAVCETPLTTRSKIRKACSLEALRRKEIWHGIRQIGKAAGPNHGLSFGQLCDIRIGQHCGRKHWPMGGLRDCIEEREVRRSDPYHHPENPSVGGFC